MLIRVVLPVPFGRKDAKRTPKVHAEGNAVKNDLALRSCPEGLADVVELEHG